MGSDREAFFYHNYPVNQLNGIQSYLPKSLTSWHKLKSKSDITAYITRLEGFETKFDQVLEGLRIREQKGIIPPKFVIRRVLDEMKSFVGSGVENNILFTNFRDKIAGIEGLSAAEKSIYEEQERIRNQNMNTGGNIGVSNDNGNSGNGGAGNGGGGKIGNENGRGPK